MEHVEARLAFELEAAKRALDVARAKHELANSAVQAMRKVVVERRVYDLHDEVLFGISTAKARLRTAHHGLLAAIVNHRKVSDLAETHTKEGHFSTGFEQDEKVDQD